MQIKILTMGAYIPNGPICFQSDALATQLPATEPEILGLFTNFTTKLSLDHCSKVIQQRGKITF